MVNSIAIGLGIAVRAFAVVLNIAGGIVPDITLPAVQTRRRMARVCVLNGVNVQVTLTISILFMCFTAWVSHIGSAHNRLAVMAGFVGKRWTGMADISRPFACLVCAHSEEAAVCRRVVQTAVAVEERRAISPVRCRLGRAVIPTIAVVAALHTEVFDKFSA
jgi:hypothetical protein